MNNARIDQMVQELYLYNRTLIGLEGKLLRLAERSRVKREIVPRALCRPRA